MNYVEPKGYFTASAKKILEAGEKSTAKKPVAKTTAKKSTKK